MDTTSAQPPVTIDALIERTHLVEQRLDAAGYAQAHDEIIPHTGPHMEDLEKSLLPFFPEAEIDNDDA
jgi:hypothetical protein